MNCKIKYRNFCKSEKSLQIFLQDWWLDAVCGEDDWDVLLSYAKDGSIRGSLCFFIKNKMGIKYITQPPLSQSTGIWLAYPETISHEKKLSFEKETCSELIEKLEKYVRKNKIVFYQQSFDSRYTNWLPFYWQNFKQTTFYTYRIHNIDDIDKVKSAFDRSKKKNLNRAIDEVRIQWDIAAKDFYDNHKMTLIKQNSQISYDYELFERIYQVAYSHNQGKTIYLTDKGGNIHATLFVIWDSTTAYYLISSIDPDFRTSGAATLGILEMIRYVSQFVNIFDFEGSMIEGVENSFIKFGAIQTPYFYINKVYTNNLLLKQLIMRKLD